MCRHMLFLTLNAEPTQFSLNEHLKDKKWNLLSEGLCLYFACGSTREEMFFPSLKRTQLQNCVLYASQLFLPKFGWQSLNQFSDN